MREVFTVRIDGWKNILELNRDFAFKKFDELAREYKDRFDSDARAPEDAREYQEFCLVSSEDDLSKLEK